jgi:hypothetical protein
MVDKNEKLHSRSPIVQISKIKNYVINQVLEMENVKKF